MPKIDRLNQVKDKTGHRATSTIYADAAGTAHSEGDTAVLSVWECQDATEQFNWGYNKIMFTVIETPEFQKQAAKVWTIEDRHAFIDWIAENPTAGDVIQGADGARKVRWSTAGKGKRGGVRVIYFNLSSDELVLLVAVYAKADRENLPPHAIKRS